MQHCRRVFPPTGKVGEFRRLGKSLGILLVVRGNDMQCDIRFLLFCCYFLMLMFCVF